MRLRARAPAKVNLCLFLGPTRGDGRHRLVTLFESISLCDDLELTPLEAGEDEVVCPGLDGPNLVAAALAGLRRAGWGAPPVRVEIRKRIPVAAGLGGGSADAAAALRLAEALAPVPEEVVGRVARELGADVPAQLAPGLALGTGAGEEVQPLEPLASHAFVIVPQEVGLSTADVYREADRLSVPRDAGELAARRRELAGAAAPGRRLPPGLLVNDLEPAGHLAGWRRCLGAGGGTPGRRRARDGLRIRSHRGRTVVGGGLRAPGPRRGERPGSALPGHVRRHPDA